MTRGTFFNFCIFFFLFHYCFSLFQAINGVHMNSLDTVYLHDTALTMATNHQRDKERVKREEVSES